MDTGASEHDQPTRMLVGLGLDEVVDEPLDVGGGQAEQPELHLQPGIEMRDLLGGGDRLGGELEIREGGGGGDEGRKRRERGLGGVLWR